MQGFLSELSDLSVMLSLICVPLATAAIFIPLGKAIAERVRRRELGAVYESLPSTQLTQRLDRLELLTASIAAETERIGEQQRLLARLLSEQGRLGGSSSSSGSEGRVITPH